jgi:hypothetical protein
MPRRWQGLFRSSGHCSILPNCLGLTAICRRRHANHTTEEPRGMALVDESCSRADFHDRNPGVSLQPFGTLYAAPKNILVRAYTGAPREQFGKVVGAHARHFGHHEKRQVFVQLIFHMLQHAMEAFFGQTASIGHEPRRKCGIALRKVNSERLRYRFGESELPPQAQPGGFSSGSPAGDLAARFAAQVQRSRPATIPRGRAPGVVGPSTAPGHRRTAQFGRNATGLVAAIGCFRTVQKYIFVDHTVAILVAPELQGAGERLRWYVYVHDLRVPSRSRSAQQECHPSRRGHSKVLARRPQLAPNGGLRSPECADGSLRTWQMLAVPTPFPQVQKMAPRRGLGILMYCHRTPFHPRNVRRGPKKFRRMDENSEDRNRASVNQCCGGNRGLVDFWDLQSAGRRALAE